MYAPPFLSSTLDPTLAIVSRAMSISPIDFARMVREFALQERRRPSTWDVVRDELEEMRRVLVRSLIEFSYLAVVGSTSVGFRPAELLPLVPENLLLSLPVASPVLTYASVATRNTWVESVPPPASPGHWNRSSLLRSNTSSPYFRPFSELTSSPLRPVDPFPSPRTFGHSPASSIRSMTEANDWVPVDLPLLE